MKTKPFTAKERRQICANRTKQLFANELFDALQAFLECPITMGSEAGYRDHYRRIKKPNPIELAKSAIKKCTP